MKVASLRDVSWEQMERFLREAFPESPLKWNRAYFDWRFRGNPLGSSEEEYSVLLDEGRVVGQAGTIKDRIWLQGAWHDATWIVDLVMSESHRKQLGPALLLRRIVQRSSLVLVSGAGPHMQRFYEALKFKRMHAGRVLYSPLHLRALLGGSR